MKFLAVILAAVVLTGCFETKDPKKKARGAHQTDKPPVPTKDESGDVAFQSFVGRLKIAVQRRDVVMLESMMAPDFGYRWDDSPPGETAFDYWQKNNLWNELAGLMNERWVPYDGYMVVPPTLATNPDFGGYRAGVRMISGNWRFAYFVSAPPAEPPPPPPAAPTSL
jgi:hypothetical protein